MDVNSLLDKCKEVCGASTESELARQLGISKQALSSYRNGHRLPDPVQCATIAGLSGIPLAKVLGVVGEARAISSDEKAVWRKLAATAALLAVVVLGAPQAHAGAGNLAFSQIKGQMHIMSSGQGYLWRLLRDWLAHKLHRPRPSPECMEAFACL